MADAAMAGRENHYRRYPAGHIDRVMADAGRDIPPFVAARRGARLHPADQGWIEGGQRRVPEGCDRGLHPARQTNLGGPGREPLAHGSERSRIAVAEIDAEENAAGGDIAGRRVDFQNADRASPRLAGRGDGRQRNLLDCSNQGGGGHHRVVPPGHRRPAMRFLALNHHLEPALPERHGHDAHIEAAIFQQLALFDMQFEIGGAILQGGRIGAALPADAAQFLAEDRAIE